MVVRLSAVICGGAVVFACSSAAMARTEASYAANRAAHDASIVGTASTYNPYRPGYRAVQRQLPASATTHLRGPRRSKLVCVKSLVASMAAKLDMRWSRVHRQNK